jgi:hypothetical protein
MSRCNFCSLEDLKKRAKLEPDIELQIEPTFGGGVNVYKIPKGEDLKRKQHFVAWFMEVGSSCEC